MYLLEIKKTANGVILITTKKGKAGKARVTVDVSGGFSDAAVDFRPTLNGDQRYELLYEGLVNGAIDEGEANPIAYADTHIGEYAYMPEMGYTDWRKELLRTARQQNYEASVSGGSEKTTFYASLGYNRQEGLALNSSLDRYSARLNMTQKIGKMGEVGANMMFTQMNQEMNEERGSAINPYLCIASTMNPSMTTGCGKTTLINLLMRFYDVCGGSIAVDGTDIWELTRSGLRRGFGMVLQDTWLETATIAENIAMGRPDATRQEIEEAAKQAHAHSFICRLPQGYDTMVENGGESLSQGQRQLLCIARVMLCRPPMLILDEATSSIDTRTEQKIQSAFLKLMEGRTAFIVAHRLSTIREADVILVMRDGHIIEQGNHAELLARKGFYAQLYESQFAV